MSYRVVLTQNAKQDLRAACLHAAQHAPQTAARWLDRVHAALQTLSEHPLRCPLAPENELVKEEIRQFLFGRGGSSSVWRALFTLQGSDVQVLHVRRASRDLARPEDLS
jgi:plasmid stabilization system protein ParE